MLKNFLARLGVGDSSEYELAQLRPVVDEINALEASFRAMSEAELRSLTEQLKQQVAEKTASPRARLEEQRQQVRSEPDPDRSRTQGQELKKLAAELRKAEDALLAEALPRAFAAVREASQRAVGMRHFDVQLMGGMVLHYGKIAEMKTGEGKTLVATLPLYLNALAGHGVHLVTVNDYLARRDGGWMGRIFNLLGLAVGLITTDFSGLYDPDYVDPKGHLEDDRLVHWKPCNRREAYEAAITYGTNNEFGFDYLRDNVVYDLKQCVQREFHYAIVDEVDNILIDEARTPLIISGPAEQAGNEYSRFAALVRPLRRNTADEEAEPNGDFNIEERTRALTLTEKGIARVEQILLQQGVLQAGESIYDPQHVALTYYLENALKAQHIFHRDKEYIVTEDGRVVLVDEHTGRPMPGRRYSEGLHQAIEAKENVHIRREDVTIATVTLQNFFRMYTKLAGMTGTAVTESKEFTSIYNLQVVVIPTNVEYIAGQPKSGLRATRWPVDGAEQTVYLDQAGQPKFFKRADLADQVYKSEEAKYRAVVSEIKDLHSRGCPVLVGTASVEHSELLSQLLRKASVTHQVLNAKHHLKEAAIIAQAGRPGVVTISTSMAGRGTDILLGGNPEGLAADRLAELCFDYAALRRLARQTLDDPQAARQLAQRERNLRLSPDLVDWASSTRAEYEAAAAEIDSRQMVGFLAWRLQSAYGMDYNDAMTLVRYIRDGSQESARQLAIERQQPLETVAQVQHWLDDYGQYLTARDQPDTLAEFIAERLFEQHYNARAALNRHVLKDELDQARQLLSKTPGFSGGLVEEIQKIKEQCERDRQSVLAEGGLRIIGTERHEARRIDNQLRGRAGRQGDPGSSLFYISLEDELMRRFGGDTMKKFMDWTQIDDSIPLEHNMLSKTIEQSQQRVEGYYFDIRKNLVEYDDVVNRQREIVYDERREVLEGSSGDLEARIRGFFEQEVGMLLDRYLEQFLPWMQSQINEAVQDHSNMESGRVNVNGLVARLQGILPQIHSLDRQQLTEMSADQVSERLYDLVQEHQASHSIRLLTQEVTRFIPLWPAPAFIGQMRTTAQRLQIQQAYTAEVKAVFDSLTANRMPAAECQQLWAVTEEPIAQAFHDLAAENVSLQERQKQQNLLIYQLNGVVSQMLVGVLKLMDRSELEEALLDRAQQVMDAWRQRIGEEDLRTYERYLVLSTLDHEWQQYLEAINDLRQGIGLEAFGQRDPKIEFKRKAFDMFDSLRESVQRTIVDSFFRNLPSHHNYVQAQRERAAMQEQAARANYRIEQHRGGGITVRRDVEKIGRNDPCPCGSGKKYKNCHGRRSGAEAPSPQPLAQESASHTPAARMPKGRVKRKH